MRRRPAALLPAALLLLLGTAPGASGAIDRVAVQLEGGHPVEVFRALPLYRGVSCRVTVQGASVEMCRRIEAGPGLEVPASAIRRSPGRISFDLAPPPGLPLGPRELRIRYEIELAGPDVFPVRVLRNGKVTGVEPRRVAAGRPVVLTFSGVEIGNAEVLATSEFRGARVLPGGSETSCRVELTFVREGTFRVPLYDRAGVPRPAPSPAEPGGYLVESGAFVEVGPPEGTGRP